MSPVQVLAEEMPKEAVKLTKEAMEVYKKQGREEAFKKFYSKKFTHGNMYVLVCGFDGVVLMHGHKPELEGRDVYYLKDIDGRYFVVEMIETAIRLGSGWVEYKWQKPSTGTIEQKITYIERVKGENIFIGAGVYPEK
jgi:methyl-accepting chemotaxis protein